MRNRIITHHYRPGQQGNHMNFHRRKVRRTIDGCHNQLFEKKCSALLRHYEQVLFSSVQVHLADSLCAALARCRAMLKSNLQCGHHHEGVHE